MTQERDPRTIQQLEARQKRLSGIMEKRVDPAILEPHITRRLGDTFERDLKVGIVNNKLRTSYERIDTELTDIQTRLDSRGDELVASAQTYLDEIAVRNAQLSQLRRLLATDDVAQDVYDRREAQFRELDARPENNPDLKRGIEIIEERKREQERLTRESEPKTSDPQEPQPPVEPKVERPVSSPEQRETELPEVKVDWRNRMVTIGGRIVSFSLHARIAWPVFMHLAKNAKNEVTYDEINRIARVAGSTSERSSGDTIGSIRDMIEPEPSNPKLVESIGYRTTSRYRFNANVEFVGEKPKMEISDDRIVFEGEELNLTERQAKVLRVLARNVDQQVLSRNLSQEAFGNPNTQETNLRDSIRQLKRILNRDGIPDVVFSETAAQNSWSALKGVEVVSEEAEVTEKGESRVDSEQPVSPSSLRLKELRAKQKETREFVLPDGSLITVKGSSSIKLFDRMVNTSEQMQISSDDLAVQLHGESSDVTRLRVTVNVSKINKNILKPAGWEIFQPVTPAERMRGEKGRYFLRKTGQIEGEGENVHLPIGTEVQLTEEQKAKNLRNLAIVEGMVSEGLLPQSTFDEARARVGDKILQKAEVPVRKPHANEYESKEFELPDGQIVKIRGLKTIKVFEQLVKTSEQVQLSTEDLAVMLYGDNNETNRDRNSALIFRINNFSLKEAGWEIHQSVSRADLNKGEKGKYYLRKIGEEAAEAETGFVTEGPVEDSKVEVSTDLPETEEIAPNGQPIQPEEPGSTQATDQPQLIEVPYEPLPEEIRSKEENLVLRTIIDYRTSHSKLFFEDIQTVLAPFIEERRATDLTGTHFRIYRAYELKELYRSAISKLRKDIAAGKNGASLPEDDKILWTKIEALAERLTSNRQNLTRLNQILSDEIDRAEREFDDQNPDLRGKEWM